jgi:hypothetical protein
MILQSGAESIHAGLRMPSACPETRLSGASIGGSSKYAPAVQYAGIRQKTIAAFLNAAFLNPD